ncbi:MAG: NlpC/P60 family protein [Peptostreptococcus anaerobius]|uniref:XkdQ/YqbQ family protein n=1 Tax=Peptostreptococcus anaerobius TaxID=1261 RepID=UPI00290E6B67|nr:NlpC/P60 family protein [Peptostreptococcus anaerobius]MDU5095410.1 NlpC/P60 family protein [Peptostreptococcus anaerobius]
MIKLLLENEDILYNITPFVSKISWEGDVKQSGRKVNFSVINSRISKLIPNFPIKNGVKVKLYDNENTKDPLFEGYIRHLSYNSSNESVDVAAFDIGATLTRHVSFNAQNFTMKKVVETVCKTHGLSIGAIAEASQTITKLFNGTTGYDAIMSCYTDFSKKNKKKYMIAIVKNKVNVIEKGISTLEITFEEGKNLISSTYTESIENMVNRLITVDEAGNKVSVKDKKDLIKLYGVMQDVISQKDKDDNSKNSKKDPDGFVLPEKTCDLEGFGDIHTITGNKVEVKDSISGLTGVFYIDSDTHTWENGAHKIKLKLNFENIMDERTVSEDKKEKTGSGGAGDWGHGITVEMVKNYLKGSRMERYASLIVEYSNAFKVDPALITAIIRSENGGNPGKNNKSSKFYNNPLSNGTKRYASIEDGLWAGIRNIAVNYVNPKGKYHAGGTIASIGRAYCPPGAANDVLGTNHMWVPNVTKFYKEIAGHEYNPKNSGGGVVSEQIARDNMNSGASNLSGNDVIEHAIKFCVDRLGTPYSQGDRNSYQRNPQRPAHFDCSAMVYYAYADAGKLPKRVSNAWTTATVHGNPKSYGLRYIPLNQAKRGDVLWMSGHLGLYLGNGRAIESTPPRSQYCPARKFTCAYRFNSF